VARRRPRQQGQELVLLDDVRIDAQLDLLRTQLDAERAEDGAAGSRALARRQAGVPEDLLEGRIRIAREALFRARREALDSQIAVLRKQIRETAEEAKRSREQIAPRRRALKLQRRSSSSKRAAARAGLRADARAS
jgi:hypothetical protein